MIDRSSPEPRPGAHCKYKTGCHNREMGDRSSHATLSSREIGRSRRDRFQTTVFCVCHALRPVSNELSISFNSNT